ARLNSRSLIPVLFTLASFGGLQFRGHFYPGQMGTLSSGYNSKRAGHCWGAAGSADGQAPA
ncbi:MAG: hypothetical protein ABSA59_18260, partial [Terriglobia bacterium]